MINAVFELGGEQICLIIDKETLFFTDVGTNTMTTIEGIQLSRGGVFKEFPDLKDNSEWRKIAIERFKEKLKKYNTEDERMNYCIQELNKYGYKPLFKQKAGFRPTKIKLNG